MMGIQLIQKQWIIRNKFLSQLTALDLIFHLSKHNIWKTKVWGKDTKEFKAANKEFVHKFLIGA